VFTKTNEIRIETCTVCNYNCQMCARGTFRRKREVMPGALFDRIVARTVEELPHINTATLSGFGEFSIDSQWRRKLEHAAQCFDRIHVVTNLSLLRREDARYLLDHVSDIRVSIYGLDPETYRRIHRSPLTVRYEEVRDGILFLAEHRKDHQRIILNYIEMEDNRHQTRDWIAYWKDKVDLIEVWKPHNWIDGKQYRVLDASRLATCGRPSGGPIQVQVDGTVNVCCFDYNGEMLIGDLRVESFASIYEGERMKRIQRLHADGRADELPLCRICDQRNGEESKAANALYNSRFPIHERIRATSTEYEVLVGGRSEGAGA